MKIEIPVYVEKDSGGESFLLRPLFSENPSVRGLELHQAMARFIADFRTRVRNAEKNELLDLVASPADWEEHRLRMRIELRKSSIPIERSVITLQRMDERVAFLPSLPDLWIVVDTTRSLRDQVAAALTEYYRRKEKEWGTDFVRGNLMSLGKTWTTITEVNVTIPAPNWKKEDDFTGLAMLFGGRSFNGAEELDKVGRCLNYLYPSSLDRAVEREHEVDELTRLLNAEDRAPTLLLGPPKVGKTAIVHEYLFRRLEEKGSPYSARNKVWMISPQRLISGMSYVGEWEERLLAIIKESRKRHHILYFDDLLALFLAGKTSNSSLSVGQVLKPYMERREVRVLSEMTQEAFHVLQECDRAFADLFHVIPVEETSDACTTRILVAASRRIEAETQCSFDLEVMPLAKQLQQQYIRDQAFPGKAAAFLHAIAEGREKEELKLDDVLRAFHSKTGLSLDLLDQRTRLSKPEIIRKLSARVMGQENAIDAMANAVVLAKGRMNDPGKPLASFLFLGPTGVGKTECAKALAEFMLGDEKKLTRFDMNEFVGPDAVARLVGTFYSPEGLLTGAVRRSPFTVLLLDEIEKAHHDVFPLLLQVMGEGRLTDSLGRVADFSNAVLILTSNLGSRDAGRQFGFTADKDDKQTHYVDAVEKFFAPEFVNRLDRVVPFRELTREEIAKVASIQIRNVINREGLVRRKSILNISDEALDRVVTAGYRPELGARALKRAIEQQFTAPLAQRLAAVPAGSPAVVTVLGTDDGIELEVDPLVEAEPRRWPELDLFLDEPKTLIDRAKAFLNRIDEEIEEFAPSGAVVADEVGSDDNLYFLIKDLLRKVQDWLRDFEQELKRRRKRGRPRQRSEVPLDLIRRCNEIEEPLLTVFMNAGELQRFVRAVPPDDLLESGPHESRVFSICREIAYIHALNEALFDEECEEFLLVVRASSGKADAYHMLTMYEMVLEMLDIACEVATPDQPFDGVALLVRGRHGALLQAEQGTCMFLKEGVPIRIDVLPVPTEADWHQVLTEFVRHREQTVEPVRRVYGPKLTLCDFITDVIVTGVDNREMRRLLLSGLDLPPELREER